MEPVLSLLVLRSAALSAAVTFYSLLGLSFTQEQHGAGPIHYASQLGGLVLELYPGTPGQAPDRRASGATMLGFQVVNLDETLAHLVSAGVPVLTPRQVTAGGLRAVVADPDGRAVELTSPAVAATARAGR